jgi:catechol 2,3-dioxygenase-like lactoylglutathione lyase family enzyme
MFIKMMYVAVFVSDQEKALDFYTKLGFEKRIDFPGPEGRFLTIGIKGQNIEVMLWKGIHGNAKQMREIPLSADPGLIFIESDDLRKDFEVLRALGVKFVETEPEDYPFGVLIKALDPDGNRIALRQTR